MSIVPALPYQLTNGTTADASQVMADLNAIASGVNTYAAPLASPTFAGTVTMPDGSTWNGSLLAYAGAKLFSGTGYVTLPSGYIRQWGGVVVSSGSGTGVVTFPIPFPNACLAVGAVVANASAPAVFPVIAIGAPSTTGVTIYGPAATEIVVGWQADGW